MSHRPERLLPIALLCVAITAGSAYGAQSEPAVTLDNSELNFAAVIRPSASPVTSPNQLVLVEPQRLDRIPYTVSTNEPWLVVTPAKGIAPSRLVIGIATSAISGPARSESGQIVVNAGPGMTSRHVIHVNLAILSGESQPPFGSLDSPPGEIVLTEQPVRLAGWALDDLAVTDVEICRDQSPALDVRGSCGGRPDAVVGHATFAYGGRPDVMKIFQTPQNFRSAWSFFIQPKSLGQSGSAPVQLSIIARDTEGHATILGKRPVRFEAVTLRTIPLPIAAALLLLAFFAAMQFMLRWRLPSLSFPPQTDVPNSQVATAWWEWTLLALVIAGFVVLEVPAMSEGLQYDELYTATHFVVGHSVSDAVSAVGGFNNHMGYSLVARVAIRLLGTAEWTLRAPSLIFGTLSIIALWVLSRALAGRLIAIISAIVLAVSPSFFTWAHLARGYAGLTFACLVSTYAFFQLLRRPAAQAAWTHAIASTLAVYLNLYGVWIIAVQYLVYVWLVFLSRRQYARGNQVNPVGLRLLWTSFSVAAVATVTLYLPVLYDLAGVMVARGRMPRNLAFPEELYHAFVASDSVAISAGVTGLAFLGLIRQTPLQAGYIILLMAAPLVVMWALVRPLDLYTRSFAYWAPFFAYLIATGFVTLFQWMNSRVSGHARLAALGMFLAGSVLLAMLIGDWVRQDRTISKSPYEDIRSLTRHDPSWPTFVVGGDAEMFGYYIPQQFEVLRSVADLQTVLHENPHFQVVYHDMSWNNTDMKQVAQDLRRWCTVHEHSPMVIFYCDAQVN